MPKPTSFAKRVLKEPKSTLKMLHYTLFEDHGRRVLVVVHEQVADRRELRRGELPRRRQLGGGGGARAANNAVADATNRSKSSAQPKLAASDRMPSSHAPNKATSL